MDADRAYSIHHASNRSTTGARYGRALLERDASFLGTFFAGVRTTSVVCISTCPAREPKRENVEFFTTLRSAMNHGYRPCKVCRPAEHAYDAPHGLKCAIDLALANPSEKLGDARLRGSGISPEQVRRWFNRHYGRTCHAFQRMYRINSAMVELSRGMTATDTAFDSGYESLSGFGYTLKKLTGRAAREQLARYFAGDRTEFSVPPETPGTDFQVRVWRALLQLPSGTMSPSSFPATA